MAKEYVQHGGAAPEGDAVGGQSKVILEEDLRRGYAFIQANHSNTGVIYIALNQGEDAVVEAGIALSAGAAYEINAVNLYVGAITAIATAEGQKYNIQVGR